MSDGSKDIILQKIRKALATPTPMPFPEAGMDLNVFQPADYDLAVAFAEKFVSIQGQFSYCVSREECLIQLRTLLVAKNWKKIYCSDNTLTTWLKMDWFSDLGSCDAAITTCEALVVRTGSIMLSAAQPKGRTASVYTPVHICIAFTSQLVPDIGDALTLIQNKYPDRPPSLITLASGPSRTADIEKTLVTGVHGPKEVFLFLIDDQDT